ncbi:MAG: hypothetical protein F6K54_28205 [Okeania sp. SIO3B5]|nr:hypothetical protein [Okeania sp. SIO3B5]
MTSTIITNLTTFLEDLKSADLVGISMIPKNIGLRLDFTYGPEVGDVAIELYQIVHLVLSQPLNYEETGYCFWVGEVKLQQLSETASEVLSSLSYPFTNSQHLTTPLIQFYLEGDICLEAICQSYKIFQEFRGE